MNYQSDIMRVPYSRAMMFLTYIKGPRTVDWTDMMTRQLNARVQAGANPNAEDLWVQVYKSFRRQYVDTQERERAEHTLQRGIKMQGRELDNYIAYFKGLVHLAGYDPNDHLCLKYFTDGLPTGLYQDVLKLDRPCNYREWKEAAIERQAMWEHINHRQERQRNPGRPHPGMFDLFSSVPIRAR